MSAGWQARGGSTRAWRQLRAAVLAEEPECHWCGLAPSTEADHVIPLAHGGADARENLVGACRDCNLARAAKVHINARPSRDW